MLAWVAAFAAAALAMMVAMVRFTSALIEPAPSSNRRMRWGLGYALSWLAIIYYINHIPADEVQARVTDRRWLSVLASSGWAACNACWVAIWFAIDRAREGAGESAPIAPDAARLVARARSIALLSALVCAVAAWNMRLPQAAFTAMFAPGARASTIAMAVAGIGFALFMAGGVRLALYGGGSQTFTITEFGEAWRGPRWRRDPSWLSVLLMFAGVITGIVGGLAAVLLMGGTTERAVVALFVSYAVLQVWRGTRRRRR